MENRNVRFIRKNGRIIPIRKDKYKKEKQLIAGGFATTIISAVATDAVISKEKNINLSDFKKKYAKDIKKAGVVFEEVPYAHVQAQYQKFGIDEIKKRENTIKLQKKIISGEIKGFKNAFKEATANIKKSIVMKNKISFSPSARKESVLLHELGHAKSTARKFSMNRFSLGSTDYGLLKNISRPWTNLISEAEATGEAARMAYKVGGKKHAAKTLLRLTPAYGTYIGGAAVATGLLMLLHKKLKKNKNGK